MNKIDKIVCVGKNYLEHAKELGDAVPERPVLFLKPPSVLLCAGQGEEVLAAWPTDQGAVHHECEIVLRLGAGGYRLSLAQAQAAIADVTLGLDMTLREQQAILKKNSHPWTVSKVFPHAAVVGPFIPCADFPNYLAEPFTFTLADGKDGQGTPQQKGQGQQMMFDPAACVAYISEFFPLCAGDLIFTGTPAGVGPWAPGQRGHLHWGKLDYLVRWQLAATL